MYVGLKVKCLLFLSDFTKIRICGQVLVKKKPEYDISLKSVRRESLCSMLERTGGGHDETNPSCFSQLVCKRILTHSMVQSPS